MERRQFLVSVWQCAAAVGLAGATGCRGTQHAKVMSADAPDLVGSHAAGAETWEPLIQGSVSQLLGRQMNEIAQVQPAGHLDGNLPRKKICFVGVENKSAEEIGDFKEQIYQKIDTCISQSEMFDVIHKRYVEAGLRQCQLRPDDLFIPGNRRMFSAAMEQLNQPFDYLMYATVTSGTTPDNKTTQRNYTLTLELIDMDSGRSEKESAELRKLYSKNRVGLRKA
ncbi:penicillin-binding protein activator LpoB [Planctellipticum variicoloris]|uniref:penicillin-binding protein activator LpoB n=1 Tax=Planctellipticum variicoloris TaxID=3064265 RepID=UPI003013D28D|nr:penicillin-binding protein activator LpoB [Planctomycetaceae bacterium SH412]